jgi:aspartyl-tRNA(Asn)/glutamyl-tRNA(Gln) amidotransferase subunit A
LHVIEEFFMEQADESVRAVTRAALDRLRSAGADLGVLRLPASFGQVIPLHTTVMAVDLAQTHFLTFMQQRAAYGPKISALIDEGLSTLAIDYALALRHQVQFRKDIEAVLQDTIAVTPATVTAAPAGLDSTGDPRFNSPWSYAGLPTVTIPCGLTEDGLPCGLQFIGPPDRDAWLLSVAEWCEQVLAFRATPPLWGDGQETT